MAYLTKEKHLKDLLEAVENTFETEAFIIAASCCDMCLKQDFKVYEIDEAIKLQSLPNIECTRKNGCVCCYGFKGKRDSNDRLIMKK